MSNKTSRRNFIKMAGVGTAAALGLGCATEARKAPVPSSAGTIRRNVVFILTDDQRYDALGVLGGRFFETPNLDALAMGGVLFENAFVTTALCGPSRASILTGQYAHQHGVIDNGRRLPVGTPMFPMMLQEAGYETAFIGKWNTSGPGDEPQKGFDHWVSFEEQGVYNDPMLNVDGERSVHKGYITDILSDYAEKFVKRPRNKPFFLFLSHKAPHADFTPAARHKGSFAGKAYQRPPSMADTDVNYAGKPAWVRAQRKSCMGVDALEGVVDYEEVPRMYAETLRAVDEGVGRIVTALREQGVFDSTLLVFTSDNGFQLGEHGLIDKRTMYEPSMRIPLVVHCPELIPPGRRNKEMVLNIDFAPTILEAAGITVPDSVQGRSFYDLLMGSQGKPPRDCFLYEYFWERWFPEIPTVVGVRTDRFKLMRYQGIWDRYELYDLEKDPTEMNNLLGEFMIGKEPCSLDFLIQNKAGDELKNLFNEMSGKLHQLLKDTNCAEEPNWHPGKTG